MTIADDLERDEGLRLKPYRDTVGKLTIGVGRNLDDVGITAVEARALLANDIAKASDGLTRALPWFLIAPEPVRRGLVNMAFNMGIAGLMQFQNMLRALETKDYNEAAVEALDSDWARQVGARADRIAGLFRSAHVA